MTDGLVNRRDVLKAACAAPLLGTIDPISRPGPAHFKLSVAAYGYRKYLDLKKPADPPMTLEQFVDVVAGMGVGAVELTSYYFRETTPPYLAKIKNHCTRLGLDVSGTAIGNDFCVADPAKRKAELDKARQWLDHSAYLGAKAMRVFAGHVPKGEREEAARARAVEALQELCEHAAQAGVFVAVENHGGITATPAQLLAIVTAVKSDWFGVNLDTFNFHGDDPYADVAQLAPFAVNVQMKTEIQAGKRPKQPADYERLLGILREARYRGYVALEYEAAEDPKSAIPREVKKVRRLMES